MDAFEFRASSSMDTNVSCKVEICGFPAADILVTDSSEFSEGFFIFVYFVKLPNFEQQLPSLKFPTFKNREDCLHFIFRQIAARKQIFCLHCCDLAEIRNSKQTNLAALKKSKIRPKHSSRTCISPFFRSKSRTFITASAVDC